MTSQLGAGGFFVLKDLPCCINIPNIWFGGMYECFSKINEETLDFEIN